jgi:hypothetical protein
MLAAIFAVKAPLTEAHPCPISPRHDAISENNDQNHQARQGLGRHARVISLSRINFTRSPA